MNAFLLQARTVMQNLCIGIGVHIKLVEPSECQEMPKTTFISSPISINNQFNQFLQLIKYLYHNVFHHRVNNFACNTCVQMCISKAMKHRVLLAKFTNSSSQTQLSHFHRWQKIITGKLEISLVQQTCLLCKKGKRQLLFSM